MSERESYRETLTRLERELAAAGRANAWDKWPEFAAIVVEAWLRKARIAAWDEGATAGWKQSGEGFNAEYPDESTGKCSVDLSANPYRNAD